MKHFVKINNVWREYDANLPTYSTCVAYGKSYVPNIDITGFETATAKSYSDLDWYGTELLHR